MPTTRAERKAALQAEAEQIIEELLDWTERATAPDLTAIEDEVLKLRQRFAEKLAEAAVTAQEAAPLTVVCAQCGRPMHQKKKRQRRSVQSRVGVVLVERAYYYCSTCQVGLFPPRRATAGGPQPLE